MEYSSNKDFKITFLGTSAFSLSPRSSTSSCLIQVGQSRILVDVGIGTLRQLRKTEISPDMLDAVLLTHWHLDHYAGLPALVKARKKPSQLPIYGPRAGHFTHLLFCTLFPIPCKEFILTKGGFELNLPDISAEAFDTIHTIDSNGWILTDKPLRNRRVVITGDTRPTDAIIKVSRRADLLIHEATYLERHSQRAITHQHTTALEAAELAVKSEVGGLVLTHTAASRYSEKEILAEAVKIYPKVIIAHSMITITISPFTDKPQKAGFGWANLNVRDQG
jgi:ribonuclease Z